MQEDKRGVTIARFREVGRQTGHRHAVPAPIEADMPIAAIVAFDLLDMAVLL
jgi:hypothetical protein